MQPPSPDTLRVAEASSASQYSAQSMAKTEPISLSESSATPHGDLPVARSITGQVSRNQFVWL